MRFEAVLREFEFFSNVIFRDATAYQAGRKKSGANLNSRSVLDCQSH